MDPQALHFQQRKAELNLFWARYERGEVDFGWGFLVLQVHKERMWGLVDPYETFDLDDLVSVSPMDRSVESVFTMEVVQDGP